MAQKHYKGLFKKALLQFVTEPDPVLAMLEWVAGQMMLIEAESKVGAEKGKHSNEADLAPAGPKKRPADSRSTGPGIRESLPRGDPSPRRGPRGLSSVLRLPGGRRQEDLFDQHAGADGAGGPATEPGDRRVPIGRILGQARDLLLMEYFEDWRSDRSYIKREKVQEVMERNRTFLTAQAAN